MFLCWKQSVMKFSVQVQTISHSLTHSLTHISLSLPKTWCYLDAGRCGSWLVVGTWCGQQENPIKRAMVLVAESLDKKHCCTKYTCLLGAALYVRSENVITSNKSRLWTLCCHMDVVNAHIPHSTHFFEFWGHDGSLAWMGGRQTTIYVSKYFIRNDICKLSESLIAEWSSAHASVKK